MKARFWRPLLLPMLTFALFAYLSVGCKKQGDTPNSITETFENQAKAFVTTAALPLTLHTVSLGAEVRADSLKTRARQVVEAMIFLRQEPGGLLLGTFDSGKLSAAEVDGFVNSFIKNGLIAEGDFLVRFDWATADGRAFHTLGTVSADGKPRFEPIMHFNQKAALSSPGVKDRSGWTWSWSNTVNNGFDIACVEVTWTVSIQTSPDGCNITDPAPHIEITKQVSNCWGWSQKTTKGEIGWCNPEQECLCKMQQGAFGEDCIKWAVVTYVATGASNIEVEASAKGEAKGIELDAKVSFDVSRFGSEATYETIRSLCAKSGGK
jgi:hypothetical protein